MFDARTKLADQVEQEVRAHFGTKVLPHRRPRTVRSRRRRRSATDHRFRSDVSRGDRLRELAREVSRGATGGLVRPGGSHPGGDGAAAAGLEEVLVASIHPNPYQPRAHSTRRRSRRWPTRSVGRVLQPVLVRPAGDGYELIAGSGAAGGAAGGAPDHPGAGTRHDALRRSSTPWSRTSTAPTSTRSRRRPPTSS